MTYKIVSDLKWFPARGIVRENKFSTVVAPSQKDELNPNGLFSGFSCEGLFHTSRWTGTKFVEHSFCIGEVTKFCSLEVESSSNVKGSVEKNSPQSAPYKKVYTGDNLHEDFKAHTKKEPSVSGTEHRIRPRNPFTGSSTPVPPSFPTKIFLGNKEYDMKTFKLEDFLRAPEGGASDSVESMVSELSKLFGLNEKEGFKKETK